ncbi:MAG: acylhydrolase [Bacteroidales bacterium]|nr:acylhydrolase [Bacteroidales bacterium]
MKKIIIAAIAALLCAATLSAQDLPDNDWAQFKRYSKANSEVAAKPLAVLMGDSITDGWYSNDPDFFKANNLLGRGISGQVTSHMLTRFRRDVVDHHPKYVVILAGINDIARNNGYISLENTFGNIVSMCEIAKANKIKPVLCTLVPSGYIRWRPAIKDTKEQVAALNAMIKEYAKAHHYKVVDYATVLADEKGETRSDLSKDSVHPNLEGYKIMEEALMKVIR